ncbi:MAG: cyclodeaminase/cyclohydrolase family protein [Bacillota bacterium]
MSEVFDWSFRKVVEVSASDSPTPGGGSVSALVGSLGASMVAMVANLTVGKEKYKDVEPQVIGIREGIYKVIGRLEELVDLDIAEFANFMKVLRMPKDTDEQKAVRTANMQTALKSATDTPLEIASTCLEALRLAHQLAGIGNKGAISDVGVGAYVAEACLHSALLSVDINLPGINDADYVAKANAEKGRLVTESKKLKEEAVAVVQERLK